MERRFNDDDKMNIYITFSSHMLIIGELGRSFIIPRGFVLCSLLLT